MDRYERAKKLAQIKVDAVGDKLKKITELKKEEIFRREIAVGKRLTVKELGQLNSHMKDDYIGIIKTLDNLMDK